MTPESIRDDEARIANAFAECNCPYCSASARGLVVADGAPSPEDYCSKSNSPRILFILKEVNSGKGGWDLRKFVMAGARPATWNNLTRWIALAHGVTLRGSLKNEDRILWLRRAVFVNLKKKPGNATAQMSVVAEFAEAHPELLGQQLQIYNPHLTVACGTHPILRRLYGNPSFVGAKCRDGLNYYDDPDLGVVLDFYHPQARMTEKELASLFKKNFRYHSNRMGWAPYRASL